MPDTLQPLLARIRAGERRAIAQAITAIENETRGAQALSTLIAEHGGRARVIGITGAPGAGKSTLINALLGELLHRGLRVAVVAVDPSSPVTGGAVLGDRVRMGEHGSDERAFIRSVSSRGHLGGLSRTTSRIVDVFDAAGFDVVLVETVGAGQSEVAITALATTRLVVCPPGLGDEVQAIKAGILEIADAFVVSKADLPAAEATARDLADMLRLRRRGGPAVPVLKTIATRGEGIREIADFALAHAAAGRPRSATVTAATSREEIAAVDRALARGADAAQFGAEPLAGDCVDAILGSAGRAPEHAGWRVTVIDDARNAFGAPVALLCSATLPSARHPLACGMWVQRVVSAAHARGVATRLVMLSDDDPRVDRLAAGADDGHPVLAIALGIAATGATRPRAAADDQAMVSS